MKSEQPQLIDKQKHALTEHDNAIVILSNGMAYLKELPQYGTIEIQVRDGKVVKGDVRTGFKI
ncbi:hypothetical protein CBF34_07125 [Vagococcus penaei]|uniref:XtrA/YqaO family protein n=1 Tax=Vagococcus penaei TaxID=633807 RepID=UPI000F882098|nr:XtrA/YqaO family protein [Vagococcus penaei]RSU01423.1 hypothetical protein CBF34_07125 [Vagococcus penaei]